jgi:AraC family ethanolamine operon transcriptional activator
MLDACYDGNGLLVLMSFHGSGAPQLHLNGVAINDRSIAIARRKTSYFATETEPGWQALVAYASDMDGRGWPAPSGELHVYQTDHAAAERVRLVIQAIFKEASALGPAFPHTAAYAAEETLTAAIDASLMATSLSDTAASLIAHVQFIRKIDEICEANPSAPVYSDQLARELGTSIRTLHSAALNIRGMTLHQYLRTKRLWAVRKELMSGELIRIKASALAHGFWHLGEFALAYRKLFGERPSETYARARQIKP